MKNLKNIPLPFGKFLCFAYRSEAEAGGIIQNPQADFAQRKF